LVVFRDREHIEAEMTVKSLSTSKLLMIFTLLLSNICDAHVDAAVDIEADGTLVGIPAKFGPGKLTITFSRELNGAPITALDIELAGQRSHLPICVTGVIESTRPDQIVASASWYHEEQYLAHYLDVVFTDPEYKAGSMFRPGFSMLFNLRTARLIAMHALISRDGGTALQRLPLDLASLSPEQYQNFIDAPNLEMKSRRSAL
jgi:hypothetical protein